MKQKDIEFFKQLLNDQLLEIKQYSKKTLNEMKSRDNVYADPLDRAADDASMRYELRIREREHRLIDKINEALERIEDGTFGYCDECGEAIERKRLLARPVTTYCIVCKTNQENREKQQISVSSQ